MCLSAVEDEQESGKREVAEWMKLVDQAEATGWRAQIAELEAQLQEARQGMQDLQAKLDAAQATVKSNELVKKHIAPRDLQLDWKLDAAKGLHEELVKSLEPTLKMLFLSYCEGKDPVQLAVELVPDGPVAVRRLSESVANLIASHALAVVKSHYLRVDVHAVEEGYAADCSEEDVD
uniref:Uncharacterized protein n=1 Tax=Oryza punctata TaxID=4537 RepID=A0A0E0MEX4_ORYPU